MKQVTAMAFACMVGLIGRADVVKTNERFVVTWNAQNGGLRSLVLRDDRDLMNWVEGFESWGEIRTNAKEIRSGGWTGAAFLDSENLPFAGMREEGDRGRTRD